MTTSNDLINEGQAVFQGIVTALTQRGLSPVLTGGVVSRSQSGNVWLVAELNKSQIVGRYEPYISNDTLHQISTLLGGKPVFLSNSTGIRYLVLLSSRPRLPRQAEYPEVLPGDDQIPLGMTVCGPLFARPQQIINAIVTGTQGSGKSTFLTAAAVTGQRYWYSLYLADPDANTFNPDYWNALLSTPVAQRQDEFETMLEKIDAELARRSALFRQAARGGLPPSDIDAYNAIASEPLARILLIADEANSYFDSNQVSDRLADLARRGRKWGLHILIAAHNWRSEDVPRKLSAMFPTRVCFRVADDTSGKVVLNSPTWGKKALRIRQETPGRGILFYNGQFRWFQSYFISRERQAALIESTCAPKPLTDMEMRLVTYAVEQLGERFIVNRLARAFAADGVTNHRVARIAEAWERRGWLTAPQHATDPRRVTEELRQLAGLAV